MNQSYGRLVSRAAIAATAMASLLLLIKIFAWWYTGSVSILAALVDSLVDIGASLTNLLVVRCWWYYWGRCCRWCTSNWDWAVFRL
ncbi:cation transporter, partial [Escherichia sp. R-CC3]